MTDDAPAPSPAPGPARVFGWKDIAAVLGVGVRAAQLRAARSFDPLPVRHNHRGPWAHTAALRDWVLRSDMSYQAHIRLEARSKRFTP